MSVKKKSVFSQIKDRMLVRKYEKEAKRIIDLVNDLNTNTEGFAVPFELDADTLEIRHKSVTPDNFGNAFHTEIWNNMGIEHQIVTLIWLDRHFAKKHNRPEAVFEIDAYADGYKAQFKEGQMHLILPLSWFEDVTKSSYEHAEIIIRFCVLAKERDRLKTFEETGQIIDLDENHLKAVGHMVTEPPALTNLVVIKSLENEEMRQLINQEKLKELEQYLVLPTKKEEKHILFYSLQPYLAEYRKELKELYDMAETAIYYLGEDETYKYYKKEEDNFVKITDEFVKERTEGKDKLQLFLTILDKQLKFQAKNENKEEIYEN